MKPSRPSTAHAPHSAPRGATATPEERLHVARFANGYGLGVGFARNDNEYMEFNWTTSTGYLAVLIPGSGTFIYTGGYTTIFTGAPVSHLLFWSCAGASNSAISGDIYTLDMNGAFLYGGWSEVDVRGLPQLGELFVYSNPLATLHARGLQNLLNLDASDTELTTLDLSGCIRLDLLGCQSSQLKNLYLPDSRALSYLTVNNNQLTYLDLSECKALLTVEMSTNQFSAEQLNAFYGLLPLRTGSFGSVYRGGNPGAGADNTALANARRWNVYNSFI